MINNYVHYSDKEKGQDELTMQEIATQKNNEKLDKLCKNICLIIGWSLFCSIFIYIIMMEISRK